MSKRMDLVRWMAVVGLVVAGGVITGCKTDEVPGPERVRVPGAVSDIANPGGIDVPTIKVADRTEVDLVEEMILHRTMYARLLNTLANYYAEHGDAVKESWARNELNDLRRVKPYRYIVDSEVPTSTLKPTESIAEADRLYKEGYDLLIKGGHHVPIFYHQDTMKLALAKFKELVDKYPTSDKIGKAAYYIGEIHKEYFEEKDNAIAAAWYRRALEWDPGMQLPVRFRLAVLLDYRMHERENALAMYHEVLEHEHIDKTNTDFSRRRIAQLTDEKTRRTPGEVVADGRSLQSSEAPLPEPGKSVKKSSPGPQ